MGTVLPLRRPFKPSRVVAENLAAADAAEARVIAARAALVDARREYQRRAVELDEATRRLQQVTTVLGHSLDLDAESVLDASRCEQERASEVMWRADDALNAEGA